ncbi:MAG: iron ABC transporter permease [Pseudomonadota bacterium]|nr:iron ABC transporter permease [Pseudomonadota bacterium]
MPLPLSTEPAPPAPALAARYRRLSRRRLGWLAALLLALLASVVVDVSLGPSQLPLADVARALWSPASADTAQRVIVWEVRLPFAVLAVLVGASLGLAGAEMQTVLNNPLASPMTLGLAAAAAVGAALAVILGLSWVVAGENLAVPLAAFAGAALSTLLIQALAWRHGASVETVVLFGIALLFAFEALLWLMQYMADANALQQIVFWNMGSLTRATWAKIGIVASVLAACALWSARDAGALTAMRGGEEQARSLGLAVGRLRLLTLLRVSLVAATALAFVGTIGFVGLVGPHIARLLLGENQRHMLPGAALAGALMLSLASILSKSLVPGVVLPIGIITALVGVPMFMALVWRSRKGL